jgi:transcriptional regulator with XRE-family HTH domain
MSATTQASETLSGYLSDRVRALRTERGWRLEDVAERARAAGLNWKWDNVAAIERGMRFLSVEELFVLPALFDLTLPELFNDTDARLLELGDACAATAGQLRQSLSGEWSLPVKADGDDSVPGLAEQKAARKFGVEPEMIMRAAQRLWGRSLAAERDARVTEYFDLESEWNDAAGTLGLRRMPARSLQAIRGHATRELLKELEPEVESRKRRRRAMRKEKRR